MRRLAIAVTALVPLAAGLAAGCSRDASPAVAEPRTDAGWVRTASSLNTDMKHPTPMTVVPADTDSRQNGGPQAGAIVPAGQGGTGASGPNGPGIASTGGPG